VSEVSIERKVDDLLTLMVQQQAELHQARQEITTIRVQATAAHEEARGAHEQARITNGRVDGHDDAFSAQTEAIRSVTEDIQSVSRALWGDERPGLNEGGIIKRLNDNQPFIESVKTMNKRLGILIGIMTPVLAGVISELIRRII
jgi:hypothetical protein